MKFSTKARTLLNLRTQIKFGKVLDCYLFTVADYGRYRRKILKEISSAFSNQVIVRSSSLKEDNFLSSNAGIFRSILHVNPNNSDDLTGAIDSVATSLGNEPSNEIFIQPMLRNVGSCGVLFTRDQDTLAPYYVVNYVDGGDTEAITKGTANQPRTFVYLKGHEQYKVRWHTQLIKLSNELEDLFENDSIDIEFAYANNDIYLLQVRPIVTSGKESLADVDVSRHIRLAEKKVKKAQAPNPLLLGDRAVFGLMPDWNPAEILGSRPKQLATTLYSALITDEIWSEQRLNYGYRDVTNTPLLLNILGIPYVDVRASFNSLIPADLPAHLAEKLVNFYTDKLSKNPKLHDKIEFEIVLSCFDFNLENKFKELRRASFTEAEIQLIRKSLLRLTERIFDYSNSPFARDLEKIDNLKDLRKNILDSDLSPIDKIFNLAAIAKKYGTLPFAGAARAAFIAVQILNSLEKVGAFPQDELLDFYGSLSTVMTELSNDSSKLDPKRFIDKYGHLRPSTYDICSPSYKERNILTKIMQTSVQRNDFCLCEQTIKSIENVFASCNWNFGIGDTLNLCKLMIESRERLKFEFSCIIDDIFVQLISLGDRFQICREDLAYLDLKLILKLKNNFSGRSLYEEIMENITKNKLDYRRTLALRLPSLIISSTDLFGYEIVDEMPNFVTMKKASGKVILIQSEDNIDVTGAIVAIESADPGYDYLFNCNLVGLITCFGGANSHMAIRCAELGIPGAIGVGELQFKQISKANSLTLDAANKKIEVVL